MFSLLLILTFIRPFISSEAFPYLNAAYSLTFTGFLLIWLISKRSLPKQIKPIKHPLILFILSLIISMVFSRDRINSLKEAYGYLPCLLLFLTACALSDKDKEKFIRSIGLAGFIISLLTIYQYFFGFQHLLEYAARKKISDSFVMDYIAAKRVFFPFVTPNALAGYLILALPLTLIIKEKNKWLPLLIMSLALLLTKSLGAFIGLFLGLGFYFCLRRKLRQKGVFFLTGLLIITALLFSVRSGAQKQHLQPVFSTAMRLSYWKDSLAIIKAAPLSGIGPGNFNLASSRYAHNSYLQIWAETGILGIISFLWLIMSVLRLGLKNLGVSAYKTRIAGLAAAGAAFLTHNLIDFTFFLPEVSLIWWAIMGLLLPE